MLAPCKLNLRTKEKVICITKSVQMRDHMSYGLILSNFVMIALCFSIQYVYLHYIGKIHHFSPYSEVLVFHSDASPLEKRSKGFDKASMLRS